MTPPRLSLQLTSSHPGTETIAGWQAQVFPLSSATRGSDTGEQPTIELAADDVLELELENGTRLLVAAEDAERYLGRTMGRGADSAGVIQVGPALRLSGPYLPTGLARDGAGAWMLKALRIFRHGPAGMTAELAARSFQDHQLGNRNGLYRLAGEHWGLSRVEAMPLSADPVLLFLHGTASSTEGSFSSLWAGDARAKLLAAYQDRIYGFEHRSLTESPIANLLDLVKGLPAGAKLHLVSHSRGGMVGELLARANRQGAAPFNEEDIARFLAHAQRTGKKGLDEDAGRLRTLNGLFRDKKIRIERFVRVAATARGTTLASGRLDRWASVMLNLLGKGLDAASMAVPGVAPVAKGYDLLQNFLLAVVKERTDARILPGLEAMMPDSPLVALLNGPQVVVDSPLHVITGDYQGDGLLSWLGDCLSEVYYGSQTDLVVNTPSMSGGAERSQGIWLKPVAGHEVNHFSYFKRDESVGPLLAALAGKNDDYQRLPGPSRVEIARGGKVTKPRPDGPIALMLPGIMGSHLAVGTDRIWFAPSSLIPGGMDHLRMKGAGESAENVSTDGWIDTYFEGFANHLAATHEVRPFVYDWRLSIADAAARFVTELDKAMDDAEARKKPLRLVAHSMGGLVARLALKGRWTRFKAIPGSRLVQFGTPNMGSHGMALVLMGRDPFVQTIERWLDWKHDMKEFLDIVRDYPGVLELLPWPVKDGKASDGVDYFDPRTWEQWAADDAENRRVRARGAEFEEAEGAGDGWLPPQAAPLAAAKTTVMALLDSPVDPDCTLYVAGSNTTPIAIRLCDGQVEMAATAAGDGRVAWADGIPKGVATWYVDAAHGDLLKHEKAFSEYVTILETGHCGLPSQPSTSRDSGTVVFMPKSLTVTTLYPTADEVLAAAVGGRPPCDKPTPRATPTVIEIVHGSLAGADSPVLIGAYAHDPLRGSAHFLDRHLKGSLAKAQAMGRYPDQPGEAMVFLPQDRNTKPGGAIVVGLGTIGELKPGELSRSLAHGLMEYVRVQEQSAKPVDTEQQVTLSTVLVGTGHAGLSVELGIRCLVDAIRNANQLIAQAGMRLKIGRVSLFEEEEARVIPAAIALCELARDRKNIGVVSYDGRIRRADGGYRGQGMDGSGFGGWYRVHITAGADDGCLRFTLVTDRARNEVVEEPDQRQAVDGLIRSATMMTVDQPGLSRALFELMVPNGFKQTLQDVRGLVLGVDATAASYPWELMRDEAEGLESPLVTRVGVVRQLASPHGRRQVPCVATRRALIVGDTQSGLAELTGAQQEGRGVEKLFKDRGYATNLLVHAEGQEVLVNLFDHEYRVVHLAAHGMVAGNGSRYTGMVLGPDTFLTTAQISKLRRVPELVFINCCHLGSMKADARPRWGRLAANLATEFIEMGCKAVVAAGWAVDDAAAETFATTFHTAMLGGSSFGEAILAARATTYQSHPASNTWGAYQAYGDERYRLDSDEVVEPPPPTYLHPGQVINDLELIQARLKRVSGPEEEASYRKQLETIEAAARPHFFHLAAIRERLGAAWADFRETARAIDHYAAALAQEDGTSSLHALEQLANLETRHGAKLMEKQVSREAGETYLHRGQERLLLIIKSLGATVERLSILASSWKRRAQALHALGSRDGIPEALAEMTKIYFAAVDLSLARNGERDYYPLLNALEGACLLATWENRTQLDEWAGQRPALLAEATSNGKRRFALERSYFHAMAEAEADRVEALWAWLDGRTVEAITEESVLIRLAHQYREVQARLGTKREHDSAETHLQALIDLTGPDIAYDPLRNALQELQRMIKNG